MGLIIPLALIIFGSVLLAIAVHMLLPPAGGDAANSEPANPIFRVLTPSTDPDAADPGDQALVMFLAWGAPGAAIVRVGTWMAREKILLTASFSA